MNQRQMIWLFFTLALFVHSPIANGQGYVFLGDLITFIINFTRIQSSIFPLYPDFEESDDHYDFIVIGSGPSGTVLANRLTTNPKVRVLLLENGEEASAITDIPILAGALGPTKYNYGYRTQPQPGFCRGCTKKSIAWEHGNALGGSSIINYMLYVRGNRRDYDRWADLGNPGWSYDDLLPYFIKVEDSHVAKGEPGYRGTGGYLTVNDVKWHTKLRDVYVEACQELGYKYVDYNGKEQIGVSNIQATTRSGLRCSAEKSYLRPVRNRSNLKIKTQSKVTKILIDPNTKVAYGVEYYHKNKPYNAFATKEVLCSAGALNSPQVLMLSGIGPRDQLEPLDIPVIKELPVGKKMYDHATFPAIIYQFNESIAINTIAELANPLTYLEFPFGDGILTSPGGVEAVTYVKVNISTDPDPLYPDIELLMVGGSLASDFGTIFRKMFNVPPLIFNKIFKPLIGKFVYQVTPILLHPKSYGSIQLKSKSPFDPPLFFANYFDHPEDIKIFIAGIREFQRINTAPSFARYNTKLVTTPIPGCETETFDTDEYWECGLRTIIGSYYHQVATCKMGPSDDIEAVVDNELRVYGIKNLRVVDTSVIPIPPSSHNVAPAYVIGEKAADLIKKTWNI
ncbi:unnamed protein product [Psylliodes chrysocephalus]|uniref:Glucose-methanol-choline oxidoreductase N-terminal domain-containing protein n=1 Tax=Psylliodes chrysocephalus TaxID=3402493 RepID=A0A9P0GJF8_9CUCU|nr:unnamed protein product [Psylliodes chrysocephala]